MSISRADVQHIALLARMHLTENELDVMAEQLSGILAHIAVLQEADVSDVAPSATLLSAAGVMRDDTARPSLAPDVLLANAPDREDQYLRVKAVLE